MGMSSNWSDIVQNFHGLGSYVQLLIEGDGDAVAGSAGGRPLGNKFFLRTAGKCKSTDSGKETDRYIYMNNIPTGNIPFISGAVGADFTELEGLIPGMLSNLNVLDPSKVYSAFTQSTTPDCSQITMETVDVDNNVSDQTHYVSLNDISEIEPCLFSPKYNDKSGKTEKFNPQSGKVCVETFSNMNENDEDGEHNVGEYKSPTFLETVGSLQLNDPVMKIYLIFLAGLGTYISYRMMTKCASMKK